MFPKCVAPSASQADEGALMAPPWGFFLVNTTKD
jgi:hypothetical protein